MAGYVLFDERLRLNPAIWGTYVLGMPEEGASSAPQIFSGGLTLDLEADLSDTVVFGLDGSVIFSSYQDFNQLTVLNPQFPVIEIYENSANLSLVQFKVKEAALDYYAEKYTLKVGYQKVLLGTYEFIFAPANSFTALDFATVSQFPEYRSMLAARLDLPFGKHFSANFVAAPSFETRSVLPLQRSVLDRALSAQSLSVSGIEINNQDPAMDLDLLVALQAKWPRVKILFELGHEHDHFFKLGGGEVKAAENGTQDLDADLVYPRRETLAAEISGTAGNWVYWVQGNYSYYPDFSKGRVVTPFGSALLHYSERTHQEAAGFKRYFPHRSAFIASQLFYGSVTGNGEEEQMVFSFSSGKEFLNGDIKLGMLGNTYFGDFEERPHFEVCLNSSYQLDSGLKFNLGGRLAEKEVFTLAQRAFVYFHLEYPF